ncbi:GTPase Era [Solobacterium sp.]|uniref:GTPase Era n=1 Tax=Solobacterium sp. TaxID=2060878 RepID=UPI001CAD39B2|nr:GTPase Era [Solobacterium sp.]MBF1077903.1 GTPase Era [Solobacterium sp.]MBF1083590.1 GTPase Era [Solobacterium sp.]MBF1099756.1 GTPase Era [Solobacterium sp.]
MRSGFVALAGRPNAGKSTLINSLIGEKVAIVSSKPQTTRSEIRGIYTDENCQIIFTDTPGIHKPKFRLESRMNKEAADVIQGVDLIYLVVDASVPYAKGDEFVLNMVKNTGLPVFLILNKMDKMKPEKIVKVIQQWQERYDFAEYFPLSAKFGRSFEDLIKTTSKYLPEGDLLYPAEMTSDGAENFRIAELIREKILTQTEDEVPHAAAVLIENKEFKKDKVYIQAMILVERDSQKGIMIGKQGQMLKKIGSLAREDIEKLLGKKVFLELFVRVESEWRSRDARITEYGYGGASRDE